VELSSTSFGSSASVVVVVAVVCFVLDWDWVSPLSKEACEPDALEQKWRG
jgi:hypothetical protein